MSGPARLAAFVALLLVLFAGGLALGRATGPEPATERAERADAGAHGSMAEDEAHPVRGLGVAEGGLRLVVDDADLRRRTLERLSFRVVDDRGATVRDFDVEHTKRLHLIVARRDLAGFQHLHPQQRPDGIWTTKIRLPAAGSWRLFADFTRNGKAHTLASDLRVDGPADLRALAAPEPTARTDRGLDVRLDAGTARPGEPSTLRFAVTRGGKPVEVQRYLGAGGHLVALREGDLAFLHVHPADDGGTAFEATFPTAGRYRLFLQVRVAGRVHTAAFTREVPQQ